MKKLADMREHEELSRIQDNQEFNQKKINDLCDKIELLEKERLQIKNACDDNWSRIQEYLVKNNLGTFEEIKALRIDDRVIFALSNEEAMRESMPKFLKSIFGSD